MSTEAKPTQLAPDTTKWNIDTSETLVLEYQFFPMETGVNTTMTKEL